MPVATALPQGFGLHGRPMTIARCLSVLALAALPSVVNAAASVTVVDLPSRGVSQRILYLKPPSPVANLLVLVGGDGRVFVQDDGSGGTELLEGSGPSRNRYRFAELGYAVAIVDVPSDLVNIGLGPYRQTPQHVADLLEVVSFMRAQADLPVWIVGQSEGNVSALHAVINLTGDLPLGTVFLSPPTRSGYALINTDLDLVRRPTLLVTHAQDRCSSIEDQTKVFEELTSTPVKEHAVLSGGTDNASCFSPGGYTQFQGLDAELVGAVSGFIAKYNGMLGAGAAVVSAAEFYHAEFDHYFVSWVDEEVAKLDAGTTIKGWTKTGASIPVFRTAQAGTSPVCRFYIPPASGDSHFYGRGITECTETAQKNPSFVLEDQAFMHVALPSAGVCPVGTIPVYRVFSNRADVNHRYTTDPSVRDAMVAKGWLAEGDGPDLVVMCSPAAP